MSRLPPAERDAAPLDPGRSLVVVKAGGAVVDGAANLALELFDSGHDVCVVHGAGAQISNALHRHGLDVRFVDGRRVTTPEGMEVVRHMLQEVNERLCAAIGPRAVGLMGDEVGLLAKPIPELGLVGEPLPSSPPAVTSAIQSGRIPVVAPLASGPLNVNADEAAACLAIALGADLLHFSVDVPGVLLHDEVLASIDVDRAQGMLDGGALEGGMVPKLRAAIVAANSRLSVQIGETAVVGPGQTA